MLNTSIPLSGMQAANLRSTAAANNIANMSSDGALPVPGQPANTPVPYQPVQVEQTATGATGGTAATVTPVSPAFVARYDPSAAYANNQGQVAAPNVDVMNEILNIAMAKTDFTANADVAGAVNQMVKQLFELRT